MLSKTLKELRKQRGWTQAQLAENATVSQQLIAKIENGRVRETRKLPLIAAAFHLTVDELLKRGSTAEVPSPRARPTAGWPFSFAQSRYDRLTKAQKQEIQGAVLRLILEYEDRRDTWRKSRRPAHHQPRRIA